MTAATTPPRPLFPVIPAPIPVVPVRRGGSRNPGAGGNGPSAAAGRYDGVTAPFSRHSGPRAGTQGWDHVLYSSPPTIAATGTIQLGSDRYSPPTRADGFDHHVRLWPRPGRPGGDVRTSSCDMSRRMPSSSRNPAGTRPRTGPCAFRSGVECVGQSQLCHQPGRKGE